MNEVRVTAPYGGVQGTALYEAMGDDGPIGGPRVGLIGVMHGDEPVGEFVFDRLEPELTGTLVRGSVLVVRANLDARAIERRHTPEGVDLNRLWDAETLAFVASLPEERRVPEHRRVLELAPLLETCTALLDLHSTSRPSPPFLVFRDDQRHAAVGARLGVRRMVTGLHEDAILEGGMSPDVGLRPGEHGTRLGFTLEAGQHADPENVDRAWAVVVRLLALHEMWGGEVPGYADPVEVFEAVDRFRQAPASTTPYRFVGYVGGEQATDRRRGPPRSLASFERIEADEVLLMRGPGSPVRARSPFTMLLPCPTAEPGTDLFYYALERPNHPGLSRLRTDAEARREAEAIEAMLDLLEDDAVARDATWAQFDPQQVLDQCADLIMRAVRLPPGHPHRRVTVVGRGEWGGGDSEVRAGRRYRQAMRSAIASGLPIDRVQLMRGAPLAWLRSLTSSTMSDLLRQRAQRRLGRGEEGTGIRLWLSTRQPHTLSLLIVGDVERALREGDAEGVRVVLIVEAATVEPDGADVAVRVVRLGLVSARPHFLRAAATLVEAQRREHHDTMSTLLPLGSGPGLFGVVRSPDGALLAPSDPTALQALGAHLARLQVTLWREALRAELGETPIRIEAGGVGRFLARVMAATGIFDAASLGALLLHETSDDGLVADVHRVDAWLADPWSLRAPRPGPRQTPPPQPLVSGDVDADNMARWVAWKRLLHSRQVVPATHGKDLDLAFSDEEIRRRIARWFREATVLSEERPGETLLVVAGDGMSPPRGGERTSESVLLAHRAALMAPGLRYLRIQHAQGTHLGWMKDLVDHVASRPVGSAPVSLQWEVEHGASVNVVLLASWDRALGDPRPWSLDGWRIERCGVVISALDPAQDRAYQLAMFTEPPPGDPDRVNLELLHFGRGHCAGLLAQGGSRIHGVGRQASRRVAGVLVAWIARWLVRARHLDPETAHEASLLARHLGLADLDLAQALSENLDVREPAIEVARQVWESIAPWPGDGPPPSGSGLSA